MNLSNNTILVTGGTGGFGYEFASKLIALGNTVIITGRNAQKLQEVKRQLPQVLHTIQSDVSKAEDIVRLYEKVTRAFPDLNILINNAGEMRKISLHHTHELPDITREIDINLIGPIRMVQQFLPHLKIKSKIKNDKEVIYPGLASVMRVLSRLAPKFLISQSGKMGESFMYGKELV